jgi:hypothetical protein
MAALVCHGRIHYIGLLMVAENKTGRYLAEKLALPVILVISLLAARLVVEMRTAIRLTTPIELSGSGLSVSMPHGNGWQCEEKWMYDDTSFTVSSIFSVDGARNEAYARCRYELVSAANAGTLAQRVRNEAAAVGGSSAQLGPIQTGRLAAGPLAVDWAGIKADLGHRGRFEVIFGDCHLSAGRRLEIEVFQTTEEPGLAQQVLEKIVEKIRFSDNGLLQAGADVVSEVRAAELVPNASALRQAQDQADGKTILFVISDTRGQVIGFTMDAMVATKTDANVVIKAASYFYVRGRIPDERVGSFFSDNTFNRFNWRIENSSRTGSRGIDMTAQEGILTVSHLRAGRKNNEYLLGAAAVPDIDIVLEPILKNVLDGSRPEIIIDLIKTDGTIVPISIKKEATDNNSVKAELLDGQGNWQQIYYTSSKERSRIIYGQENSYTLQRADANQITVLFPEQAYLVRDQKQFLEREVP